MGFWENIVENTIIASIYKNRRKLTVLLCLVGIRKRNSKGVQYSSSFRSCKVKNSCISSAKFYKASEKTVMAGAECGWKIS